jgi:hypothetical protein
VYFYTESLFFWLNAFFGGVKHPALQLQMLKTNVKPFICRSFVGSGSVTPPLKYFFQGYHPTGDKTIIQILILLIKICVCALNQKSKDRMIDMTESFFKKE